MLRTTIYSLALVAFLAGCTQQGVIQGRLEMSGAPGSQAVTMDWQMDPFDSAGKLAVTLPSGELFTGRYLQITTTSTADSLGTAWGGWGGWGPYWADWGSYGGPWMGGSSYSTFLQNYSGKVISTLFGNLGDVMRCRFQLANPSEGMPGGGVGECQLKSGDTIAVQF
ncbi:MAG: hypothetical protein VCC00_15135 [Deltaproteobacteria bacterium]